jgi:MoaA/NifB/PqqE/SkfB family radical SAM enzyme
MLHYIVLIVFIYCDLIGFSESSKIIIAGETEYPWLVEGLDKKSLESMKLDNSAKIGCTAGSSSFYITPDGHVRFCVILQRVM